MRIEMRRACVIALLATVTGAGTISAQDAKATEVLAGARKAIGGRKLESMTSLSVQAALQRNVGNFQMSSDLELLLALPDKYVRSESSNNPMVSVASTTGFVGDRPITSGQPGAAPGGAMIIRMGGPGMPIPGPPEKLTPEQQAQLDRQVVRAAKFEVGRLMLGWFAISHPSLSVQYTFAGEAESADGKAFIIDVKGADGFSARLFVDQATHLPLMVTYKAAALKTVTVGGPGPGGGGDRPPESQPTAATGEARPRLDADARRPVDQGQMQAPAMLDYTLYFDDWREEDGIKFPHSLRRAAAGATMEEWTVSKVKVNPKIDPKKFEGD